jgi:hypothetical protein
MDKNKMAQFESSEERRLTERQALYLSRRRILRARSWSACQGARVAEVVTRSVAPIVSSYLRESGQAQSGYRKL